MNQHIEIKYTLCFIQKEKEILMLNRMKSPNMGLWNGVGGKIEPNEEKFSSIKREILEETGLKIDAVDFKGDVFWTSKNSIGGMHVFLANFPKEINSISFPQDTDEGILSFKHIDWIFSKENKGLISNIPIFLSEMLNSINILNFHFFYDENDLILKYDKF